MKVLLLVWLAVVLAVCGLVVVVGPFLPEIPEEDEREP